MASAQLSALASAYLPVPVLGEKLTMVWPADGRHLLLWIAPPHGTHERARNLASALAAR